MAGKKPDKVVQLIADTLDAAKVKEATVQGGPVAVPLDRAAALWLIPWICEPECRLGARVTEPKAKKSKALYATPGDTRDALGLLRELAAILAKVKSGKLEFLAVAAEEMNLAAAEDDEDDVDPPPANAAARRAAARFRLSGSVEGGVWNVSHAFPRVTAAQLRDAFEILNLVDGSSKQWARDADEAATIGDLAAKSTGFIRTNPAQKQQNFLELNGAEIHVLEERRPYLAIAVMRRRLGGGPWDVGTHRKWDEEFLAATIESLRQMNERAAKLREKYYAPRLRTVLESPVTAYYETNFAQIPFSPDSAVTPLIWKRVDNIDYKAEIPFVEALPLVDIQFVTLGFRRLGDFQNGKQDRAQAFRAYGGTSDGTLVLWGIVAGAFVMHWMFYTLLGKDFWVITATFPKPKASPERSSHRDAGKMSLQDMNAEHAKHVAEHASEGAPHPSPKNLDELVRLMDAFNAACPS